MIRLYSWLLVFSLASSSCTTLYYNFWETLGREKRDLLSSEVAAVNDEQNEIEQEFKDTLSKIRSEYSFDGGDLERTYDLLSEDYRDILAIKNQLSARINRTESIAGDLFEEWQTEAQQINNSRLKRDSLLKRSASRKEFSRMLADMRRVEKEVEPLLIRFNDQVLYLKHNLNARAVGAFKDEFGDIERQFQRLSKQIQSSSSKASQFIGSIN